MTPEQALHTLLATRSDRRFVRLEGFHPVKHAIRFAAPIELVLTADPDRLARLAHALAPDLVKPLAALATPVPRPLWSARPEIADLDVVALARRPSFSPAEIMGAIDPHGANWVLLDKPTHLGNVGAVVRVAAAANAAGVLVTGDLDPWHPAAVRGSAGLHYALPVQRVDDVRNLPATIVAVDAEGQSIEGCASITGSVLAFGSERRGLSEEVRARATRTVAIPMRPGISSLNLATAVAVTLYSRAVRRP